MSASQASVRSRSAREHLLRQGGLPQRHLENPNGRMHSRPTGSPPHPVRDTIGQQVVADRNRGVDGSVRLGHRSARNTDQVRCSVEPHGRQPTHGECRGDLCHGPRGGWLGNCHPAQANPVTRDDSTPCRLLQHEGPEDRDSNDPIVTPARHRPERSPCRWSLQSRTPQHRLQSSPGRPRPVRTGDRQPAGPRQDARRRTSVRSA